MKIVLKDQTEITISSMNDNYNPANVDDDERRSLSFSIVDPVDDVTIEYLVGILTEDNLSDLKVVSNGVTKTINPCKVTNITNNISDNAHFITIRTAFV